MNFTFFDSFSFGILFALTIFFIALIGFVFNGGNNLIMQLISLELIFFSICLLFVQLSFLFDDMSGALLALYILPIAGAESAIGLALLIAFYPTRGSITINKGLVTSTRG